MTHRHNEGWRGGRCWHNRATAGVAPPLPLAAKHPGPTRRCRRGGRRLRVLGTAWHHNRSGDVSIKEFVAQLMPKDYPDKNP